MLPGEDLKLAEELMREIKLQRRSGGHLPPLRESPLTLVRCNCLGSFEQLKGIVLARPDVCSLASQQMGAESDRGVWVCTTKCSLRESLGSQMPTLVESNLGLCEQNRRALAYSLNSPRSPRSEGGQPTGVQEIVHRPDQ